MSAILHTGKRPFLELQLLLYKSACSLPNLM